MSRLEGQPETLQLGPLFLKLHPSPCGPRIDTDDDSIMSLVWLVEGAVADAVLANEENNDEAFQAICEGTAWFHEIMILRPPDPEYDDVIALRQQWEHLIADEADTDLRVLSVASYDKVLLPQSLLKELAITLYDLMQRFSVEPPWLFCSDACGTNHSSEYDTVMQAETACADDQDVDLKGLGLCDTGAFARQRLDQLLLWGADALARGYIQLLHEADKLDLPVQAGWLFNQPAYYHQPHPDEKICIQELEEQAADINTREQALDDTEEPADLIEDRRALLHSMHKYGLLDRGNQLSKEHLLNRWDCPALSTLYAAACKALDYLQSYSRRKRLGDDMEYELLRAPICIDLFRGLSVPEKVSLYDWVAWGEYLLRTHGPATDVTTDQGWLPYHDQDGLIHVLWRRDFDVPALRYLSLQQ